MPLLGMLQIYGCSISFNSALRSAHPMVLFYDQIFPALSYSEHPVLIKYGPVLPGRKHFEEWFVRDAMWRPCNSPSHRKPLLGSPTL